MIFFVKTPDYIEKKKQLTILNSVAEVNDFENTLLKSAA